VGKLLFVLFVPFVVKLHSATCLPAGRSAI